MGVSDRIERAARARHERTRLAFPLRKHVPYDELHPSARQMLETVVRQDIEVAFPELFSTPPTHWVAPMEATDEMFVAFVESEVSFCEEHDTYENAARFGWRAMRDAHLKEPAE